MLAHMRLTGLANCARLQRSFTRSFGDPRSLHHLCCCNISRRPALLTPIVLTLNSVQQVFKGSTAAAASSMSTTASAAGAAVVVYVTVPNMDTGSSIAKALVEDKLAACVNIIPGLTSVYWWKDKVESDSELLLMIKTSASLVDALTAKVKSLHPYDECEVIATPIVGGSASYIQWILDSTSKNRTWKE